MSLHGLLSVTIGVPNVEETAAYYTDFGLAPAAGGWFSTADGGPQLQIVPTPTRRLVELRSGSKRSTNELRMKSLPVLAPSFWPSGRTTGASQ